MNVAKWRWMLLAVILAACEMSEPDSPIMSESDSPIIETAVDDSSAQPNAEVGGGDGADIVPCVRTGSRTPFMRADCTGLDNEEPPHAAIACCSGRGIWRCPGEGENAAEICVN